MDAPAGTEAARAGAATHAGTASRAGTVPRDERPGRLDHPRLDHPRLRAPTPRVALLLIAAVVVAFVLYLGREALAPFVVGLLLVYLLHPPVEWLHRIGVPRILAVLVVYAIVVVVLFEAVNLTLRPVVEQLQAFSADLPTLAAQLDSQIGRLGETYRALDLPLPVREAIDRWLTELASRGGELDPSVLLPVFNLTAGLIGGLFGYVIIPVWAFYLLKDRPSLTRAFDRSLPAEWHDDVWGVIGVVRRVFGQWVRGQVVLGVTVGLGTFVGLMALNGLVDPVFGRFAVLLAIISGVLELLPIIGPIIAAIPAILLALTAGPEAAIAATVLYVGIQQVENVFLVPKIQGDAVQLHPSVVMFALIIGAAIAGLLGAILALPITAAGRDVYRYLFRRLSETSTAGSLAGAGQGSAAEAAVNEPPADVQEPNRVVEPGAPDDHAAGSPGEATPGPLRGPEPGHPGAGGREPEAERG